MSGNPTTSPAITGLQVTSTSTPALNGTYRATEQMLAGLMGEAAAVALNGTFADGTASLNWPDVSGVMHAFDVAQFKPFAAAMFSFANGTLMFGLNETTTRPPTTATIP